MKKSFTLIELLVVIAIIAILAAILMPALSQARERGKTTTCINNMKSFGVAIGAYADDFTTYPWPADKAWSLPKSTSTSNFTIWSLLTGHQGSVKYSNSYILPRKEKGVIKGATPALTCSSHDGQNNTSTTLVAHYMFFSSSSNPSEYSQGMTSSVRDLTLTPPRRSIAPQNVKLPASKLAMVERSLDNFALGDYAYTIEDYRYLYDADITTNRNKTGPVHNGKASGLHYDGHVSMLDMEGEFFASTTDRGKEIWKRYINPLIVF